MLQQLPFHIKQHFQWQFSSIQYQNFLRVWHFGSLGTILVLHGISSPLFWVNVEFSGSHNSQRYMLGPETQMDACLVEHGFNIYWRC